ncbi:MAG TPA: cysteine desulfurase-like protein [Nocardioidaceae bacterium]|nr:cysteine desulfurase-like protein [Nocardioidaceae bacterium]
MSTLDVSGVRSHFPALEQGVAYFDGPGGTQVPREVGDKIIETITGGISNRGTVTHVERLAESVVTGARAAVADLLGCAAEGVVFGRSMTQVTLDIARALARTWQPGDEVVVTRLDHDANIRPWVIAAATAGASVRWVGFDTTTADLSVDDVAAQLSPHTRLVAVTGASNLLGTRPDVASIAAAVHDLGTDALVYVDGVHLTPHAPVSVADLGADFYACSPYKFLGPHHGLVAASPDLLETLQPDKLLPSSNDVPERFELGTLPYEMLAGTTAAIDFLAGLASTAPDRRTRILESMTAVAEHEDAMFARLMDGLLGLDGVTVHGSPKVRTPTALFSVDGHSPREVYEHLATLDVNAPAGSFYALEAARWFGLGDAGAVRAGIAPYTNADDVDRLLAGVAQVAGRGR